jgi:chitinase
VQVQHYNSAARAARDLNVYLPGTADFHVAMAEMLLQGFAIEGAARHRFPPLRPEQIVMGLAAWPEAVNNGYTAPLEMEKVLNYLTKGEPFGGIYQLHDSLRYRCLRGVMTWSINWDAAHHWTFSNAIRSYLDALL